MLSPLQRASWLPEAAHAIGHAKFMGEDGACLFPPRASMSLLRVGG